MEKDNKYINVASKKNKIMITFKEDGQNGGPYNSHKRIMEGGLSEKYDFIPLVIPKGRLKLINISLTRNLLTQIKQHQPDIIHFTGLELVGFHIALACKIAGHKRTVVAIHGSSSESIELKKSKLKLLILQILEILTLRIATHSYGVSDYVSSWNKVKKYSKNYFGTIYNIIGLEAGLNKTIDLRSTLALGISDRIVISVGRIEIEKGYSILSDVIKNDTNSNVKYVIVGDGSYLKTMKKELETQEIIGKVLFLGYRQDVQHILDQADIFVIASFHETLCMALAEAGYSGLALIGPKVGGVPEIINEDLNGFLISSQESINYSKKIDLLASNEKLLARMKKESAEHIRIKFNSSKIEQKLSQLYDSI